MKTIFVFIYLFILTTFITRTSGEAGVGIMGRLTMADIFAAMSIFIFMIYILNTKRKIRFPKILKAFYFLITTFVLGLFTSLNQLGTTLELIILIFLSLIFIVLINIHKNEKDFLNLVFIVSIASFLAAFTGIWDVLSVFVGLPRFFPRDPDLSNLAVSGFRNSGQAGAYMLITISILISVISSSLYEKYSRVQQTFLKISLFVSILFLFLTFKIAAYIGLAIGLFFFALKKRKIKIIFTMSFFASILLLVSMNLETVAPSLHNWMIYKTDSRLKGDGSEKFISHNLSNAMRAFSDNPITGSGIGGFAGVYEKHEVHSTYFKIIGETGLLGFVGYMVFMIILFKMIYIKKSRFKNNPYAEFLSNMQPFFIGFLVSWGYTYHLRKREFWIMVAIIYLAHALAKKYQRQVKKNRGL